LKYIELKRIQTKEHDPIYIRSSPEVGIAPDTTPNPEDIDCQHDGERVSEVPSDGVKSKKSGKRPSNNPHTSPIPTKRPRKSGSNESPNRTINLDDSSTKSRPRPKSSRVPEDCEIIDISSDDEIVFASRVLPVPAPFEIFYTDANQ
jgi:hypothetical protein